MEQEVIRISNIKCKPNDGLDLIEKKIRKALNLGKEDIKYEILKRSIDSRHKPEIIYLYSVNVLSVKGKSFKDILKRTRDKNVTLSKKIIYQLDTSTKGREISEEERPVIIGFGPAGFFAALNLSRMGLRPIVYERGLEISKRQEKVNGFWSGEKLDLNCNVQFGEGGAGTFSDGKLNSSIHESTGRISYVLNTFVEHGANPEILYVNKPHIGTDVLAKVIVSIREEIKANGGEIHFASKLEAINLKANPSGEKEIDSLEIKDLTTGKIFTKTARKVILAIGHSARDTFEMLDKLGIMMTAKPFAVGVRVEHKQELINRNAYGAALDNPNYKLPTADYKVTYKTHASGEERGVYSFCMCPGGYVVNASSEEGELAVNGMSYSSRAGENANSAIIVTVTPKDFGENVLDGMKFQRKLEAAAYREGEGKIPVQTFGDFDKGVKSTSLGKVMPNTKGDYKLSNLREVLPEFITSSLTEGIHGFDKFIKGYDNEETLLLGVESRTSSPVKILRNDDYYSINIKGLIPCGEGAGYAGGITSAAVDGMKACEAIAKGFIN